MRFIYAEQAARYGKKLEEVSTMATCTWKAMSWLLNTMHGCLKSETRSCWTLRDVHYQAGCRKNQEVTSPCLSLDCNDIVVIFVAYILDVCFCLCCCHGKPVVVINC